MYNNMKANKNNMLPTIIIIGMGLFVSMPTSFATVKDDSMHILNNNEADTDETKKYRDMWRTRYKRYKASPQKLIRKTREMSDQHPLMINSSFNSTCYKDDIVEILITHVVWTSPSPLVDKKRPTGSTIVIWDVDPDYELVPNEKYQAFVDELLIPLFLSNSNFEVEYYYIIENWVQQQIDDIQASKRADPYGTVLYYRPLNFLTAIRQKGSDRFLLDSSIEAPINYSDRWEYCSYAEMRREQQRIEIRQESNQTIQQESQEESKLKKRHRAKDEAHSDNDQQMLKVLEKKAKVTRPTPFAKSKESTKARPVKQKDGFQISHVYASRNSRYFHRPDCDELKNISSDEKIDFPSSECAIRDGATPCGKCNP